MTAHRRPLLKNLTLPIAVMTVAGTAGAVVMPTAETDAVLKQADAQRVQLAQRVKAVRDSLSLATQPSVLAAQGLSWTNWPKWSKWSNWANQ